MYWSTGFWLISTEGGSGEIPVEFWVANMN